MKISEAVIGLHNLWIRGLPGRESFPVIGDKHTIAAGNEDHLLRQKFLRKGADLAGFLQKETIGMQLKHLCLMLEYSMLNKAY